MKPFSLLDEVTRYLRDELQCSYVDIAEYFMTSEETVRVRIYRARKHTPSARKGKHIPRFRTEDRDAKIARLVESGLDRTTLCQRFNLSPGGLNAAIWRYRRRMRPTSTVAGTGFQSV